MDALCVGFSSLDIVIEGWEGFPPPGEHTRFLDAVNFSVGGDAANQSRVLAQLGHDVSLATAVGKDLAGDAIRAALAAAGVDCSLISVRADLPTSLCFVDLKDNGERAFAAPRNGTARWIGPTDIDVDPIPAGLRVVSVGSLNCSRDLDALVLPGLLARARKQGAIVVADMVSDHPEVGPAELEPVLRHVDYLMPSELEMSLYSGQRDPVAAAEVFSNRGVGAVVVKQGAEGATLIRSGDVMHCPAFPTEVVDTTGAGDSYVAGFVSGLLRGMPEGECLRFAAATAAIAVTSKGAYCPGLDVKQVMSMMSRH